MVFLLVKKIFWFLELYPSLSILLAEHVLSIPTHHITRPPISQVNLLASLIVHPSEKPVLSGVTGSAIASYSFPLQARLAQVKLN